MDRNRLQGLAGDMFNAILSAAGMNFRKLVAHAAAVGALLLALVHDFIRRCRQIESCAPALVQLNSLKPLETGFFRID